MLPTSCSDDIETSKHKTHYNYWWSIPNHPRNYHSKPDLPGRLASINQNPYSTPAFIRLTDITPIQLHTHEHQTTPRQDPNINLTDQLLFFLRGPSGIVIDPMVAFESLNRLEELSQVSIGEYWVLDLWFSGVVGLRWRRLDFRRDRDFGVFGRHFVLQTFVELYWFTWWSSRDGTNDSVKALIQISFSRRLDTYMHSYISWKLPSKKSVAAFRYCRHWMGMLPSVLRCRNLVGVV